MFFSEIQSHKWAHKAAVTRTDLLSTWLLFHRCHGECPGLFLIPTVVFHPRYPQSPYKDRKKGTSRMFQLPKAEDVYCFCFFLQCLKLNPRCWVPAYCLLVTDKAQVHRRPAPVLCLYLAHLPTVPTEILPTVSHLHSWLISNLLSLQPFLAIESPMHPKAGKPC